MRRLKVCLLASFAILAFAAVMAATASALPQIHEGLGEGFPISAEGSAKGANIAQLSTALSAPITSSEVKLSVEAKELGSLFPYTATFTGAEIEGKTCSTAGDAAGTILVTKNELHLVWTSLSPLALAADFLVAKFTITCVKGTESLKITVEGQALGKIEGVKDMEDFTSFTGNLKCTKPGNGKQEVKEYFNDEEKLVKGVLTANLGLGPETGCEEVKEPVTIKSAKMFQFLF
jgi:hypothetical protein